MILLLCCSRGFCPSFEEVRWDLRASCHMSVAVATSALITAKAVRCPSSRECRRGTAKSVAWYDEVQASATADIANTFNSWVQRPNQRYKGQTVSSKMIVEKGKGPCPHPQSIPCLCLRLRAIRRLA